MSSTYLKASETADMNPVNTAEEICHLAVFFNVVHNPDIKVFVLNNWVCAFTRALPIFRKAACPVVPALSKLCDSTSTLSPATAMLLANLPMSKVPVFGFIALFK